jgi:hypothetical protein
MPLMAEDDTRRAPVSYESRLLLLTIAVCVVVLLLLARLRFPESPPVVERAVQPLDRLAAQASYDALAADIQRVEATISPNLVVLRIASRVDSPPRRTGDVLVPPDTSDDVRHVAALRITSDTAVAAMAPDMRIDGIVGAGVNGTAAVRAIDPLRRVARVRVPQGDARPVTSLQLSELRTPVYVVAVEGTHAGVTLRPIFLGRGDRFGSARWTRPLLPLGGIAVSPGALLFSLAGEFVGCVVIEDGAPAIAGAADVLEAAERLAASPSLVPGTLGVAVQPLTAELAAALGTVSGVVVAEVEPQGPASGLLRPGDVVTALGGEPVTSPDRFLLRLATRQAGEPVALTIVRGGETLPVKAVLGVADSVVRASGETVGFGRARDGGTRVVAANRTSGYLGTGLRPGDLVVSAGELTDPSPAQLRRLLAEARPNTLLVFTIRRGGEQRVVAVPAPAQPNASRN